MGRGGGDVSRRCKTRSWMTYAVDCLHPAVFHLNRNQVDAGNSVLHLELPDLNTSFRSLIAMRSQMLMEPSITSTCHLWMSMESPADEGDQFLATRNLGLSDFARVKYSCVACYSPGSGIFAQ